MKKISQNTVKSFLKGVGRTDVFAREYGDGDGAFEVKFRTALDVDEKSLFVNRVVSGCFDAAGNYRPEYFEAVFRATVIQMLTDLPALTLRGETTEDGGAALDLDGMSGLYEALGLRELEDDGWQETVGRLELMCQEAVEWRKKREMADLGVDAALRRLLDTLTKKAESVDVEALADYAGKIAKAVEGLDEGAVLDGLIEAGTKGRAE